MARKRSKGKKLPAGARRLEPRRRRTSRGSSLAVAALILLWGGAHAPPTWGTPPGREAVRARVSSVGVQETARRVLGQRRASSPRSARARTLRDRLVELRRGVATFSSNPSPEDRSRLHEGRQAAGELFRGRSKSDRTLGSAEATKRRMDALLADLEALEKEPGRRADDVPRLLEEIDAALEAPELISSRTVTLIPLPADLDQ